MSDAIKETLTSPGWREIEARLRDKVVDCYLSYPTTKTWEEKRDLDAHIFRLRELLNTPVEYDLKPAGFAEREIAEGIEEAL
jgi:hypothetical protein